MQLQPFKTLIGLSKEKLDEAMAPIRAKQVKAKADLEMSTIDADLVVLESVIQEMCAERDINLPDLIDKLDEAAILERRKVKYGEVLKQLFPSEKKTKAKK